MPTIIQSLLLDDRLTVRLATLWGLGIACNLAAWTMGYYWIPETALRGIFPGSGLIPKGGDVSTLVSILLYNVLLAGGLIVASNLFRVRWLPIGYVPVLFHWTGFGLFLGTNSFDVTHDAKLAPAPLQLFETTGFIEISAYTFLAVATIGLFIYRQPSWWSGATRVHSWSDLRLSRCEWMTIGLAVLLIVAAAYRETLSLALHA